MAALIERRLATGGIRMIIADRQPLVRAGLISCLARTEDLHVLGETEDVDHVADLARREKPDIVLLDPNVPGGGAWLVRSVAAACPNAQIVVLTASTDPNSLLRAVAAGAAAYVLKQIPIVDLLQILRAVHSGVRYVPPGLAWAIVRQRTESTADPLRLLDTHERQILDLLASGLSDTDIAHYLGLSPRTVARRVSQIVARLGLHGRLEAALFGNRHGLGQGTELGTLP
jgi:two-component system, NarL family, nitrate/nitrite response regulator NarL